MTLFTKYDDYFEGIVLSDNQREVNDYLKRKEKRLKYVEDLKNSNATEEVINAAIKKYIKPDKINFRLQNKVRFPNGNLNVFLESLIYSKYNMLVSVLVSKKEEVSILLISEVDFQSFKNINTLNLKTKTVQNFEDLINSLSNSKTKSKFKYLIPLDVFLTNLMETTVKYEYDELFDEWVLNIKLNVTKDEIPKGTKCLGCPFFDEETAPIKTVEGKHVGDRKIYSCYYLETTSDEEPNLLDHRMCGINYE